MKKKKEIEKMKWEREKKKGGNWILVYAYEARSEDLGWMLR